MHDLRRIHLNLFLPNESHQMEGNSFFFSHQSNFKVKELGVKMEAFPYVNIYVRESHHSANEDNMLVVGPLT